MFDDPKAYVMRERKDDGQVTINYLETANDFNKGFQSVFIRESEEELSPFNFFYIGPVLDNINKSLKRWITFYHLKNNGT